MDVSQFKDTIIETCKHQCKTIAWLLAIGMLFLIIDIVCYCVTKSNDGFSLWKLCVDKTFKNRFTTKEQILLKLVGIVALLILAAWTIIPVYRDVSKQQYISVEGSCTYKNASRKNILSDGSIRVETEDDEFYLELPSDWNMNMFSDETVYGEIWYSKESKILVSFTPQS